MRNPVAIAAVVAVAVAALLLLRAVRSSGDPARAPAAPPETEPSAQNEPAAPRPAADAAADDESDETEDPGAPAPEIAVRPAPTDLERQQAGERQDAGPNPAAESEAVQVAISAYNEQRYEDAREAALEALERFPRNRDMRRLVVTASCIMRDAETAKQHWALLSATDKKPVRRCEANGIILR